MITHKHNHYHCARICFECQSPLSIKADDSDPTLDTTLMTDATGNAIIPGTSIAGVLRHLYEEKYKEDVLKEDALFGKTSVKHDDHRPSLVKISFGFIHNAKNQPQMGVVETSASDDILSYLQNTPIIREQTKINQSGTTTDAAKFDRSALPKGTRFSFELGLSGEQSNKTQWAQLLSLLSHPKFRLGGLTHRGFGKVKIIDLYEQDFDFTNSADIKKWQAHQQSDWTVQNNHCTASNEYVNLTITAEDFWRIGSGDEALGAYSKDPDDKPYTETTLNWHNNQATLSEKLVVVPATAIKGALRHRTLFHLRLLNLLNKDFSDTEIKEEDIDLCKLFGAKAEKNTQQGIGGLLIDDVYLPNHSTPKIMMHNKIDRFTGGVMNGALFSEELLYQDTLNISMYFDPHKLKLLNTCVQNAFIKAIQDLCEGRLSLGAGSAKGHGYFTGESASIIQKFKESCQ